MVNEILPLDTLLKNLDDSNYDSLIKQEELRNKGFIFHYVIDIDLIGIYCFPRGINKANDIRTTNSAITEEYLADEQVTLHALFYLHKNSHRVIILDEYYQELYGFIRYARINSKPKNNIGGGLFDEKTLNDLEKYNEKEELVNLIKDYFSRLLAEVTLRINGLKKISNLFNEKTLIFDAKELENPLLTSAFEYSKKENDNIVNEIFNLYDTKNKNYKNEISKKVDAKIFNRVLLVNDFLSKNKEDKNSKHVFMFIGDSNANENVFEKLKNKNYYPSIDNEKIKLYRTVNELFAYLICTEYDEKGNINSEKTISNLELLKKYAKTINDTLNETQGHISQLRHEEIANNFMISDEFKMFFSRYLKLRNSFENAGLFQSFKLLYDSITNDLIKQNFSQIKNIFEKLNKQFEEIEKELKSYEDRITELDNENKVNNIITLGFEKIRAGEKFELKKGYDLIEGSYQFLPIIFKIQNKSELKDFYKKPLNDLVNLILSKNINNSHHVCHSLTELFKSLENSNTKYHYPIEEKIIKTLVFLILPNSNENDNNSFFINWIIKSEKDQNLPNELREELWYILTWIYRRGKNYKEALLYAEKGIESARNDPRFYHGRLLANYCLWEEKTPKSLKNLNQIIDDMETSKSYYETFINVNYDGTLKEKLLLKMKDTFLNNSCYFFTEKAYLLYDKNLNSAKEYITNAREHLKGLKDINGNYREELPEYFDTESNLEFVESFILEDKIKRLEHAKDAIIKAINLSNHSELLEKYKNKHKKIEERIIELNNQS